MNSEERKVAHQAMYWIQDYLARRSHSEKELHEKLSKKGFSKEIANYAINYAKKEKWLEPPEELSLKVYSEWNRKNKSHSWINGYLQKKGLPLQPSNKNMESQKAYFHLKKKFGIIDKKNYQKASVNIASKGFSYEDFKNGLELLKKDE